MSKLVKEEVLQESDERMPCKVCGKPKTWIKAIYEDFDATFTVCPEHGAFPDLVGKEREGL